VCVGIAPSKTLAKLSNFVAKTRLKHHGVFDFSRLSAEEQDQLLVSIDTGEVWGIGRRLAERLGQCGIVTVKDLRDAEPKTLRREFSVVVERTVLELRGVSCLSLEEVTQPKKEIISSRSFGQADNIPGGEMPKFRNLWEHIRIKMPKKGRGKAHALDPLSIPVELQTALLSRQKPLKWLCRPPPRARLPAGPVPCTGR